MKKNRLLLLLNASVVALAPTVHAQDAQDVVHDADAVTKQQLEQFLSEKPADAVSNDTALQTPADTAQVAEHAATNAADDSSAHETQVVHQEAASPEAAPHTDATNVEHVEQAATTETHEAEVTSQEHADAPAAADQDESVPEEIEVPAHPEPFGPVVHAAPAEAVAAPVVADHQEPVTPVTAPEAHVETSAPVVHQEAPAAPTHQEPAVTEEQLEESLLDTIDIQEGGNWVLKRKALQDTVRKIEDINALYDDIRDTNIVFLQGINTVDVLFTQFSYDVGLDLGKVDQLVQDVAHHLESEREHEGDLSEEERELLVKAEERKKEIEQLRSNIHDIWLAHDQLKEARGLNDEQIIEADRLRKQAWRNFRMIEKVLNEVRAEELYHETVQLFEAMQTSYRYLQTRLIPHFETSIKTIQEKMKTVKQQAEELQNQGVLLKEQAKDLHNKEQLEGLEEVEVANKPATGWFGTVKNILWAPFGAIGSVWNWLTGSSDDMKKYLPDEDQSHTANDHETKQPDEL